MKDIINDVYNKLDAEDEVIIRKITRRAADIYTKHGHKADILSIEMDLSVVHTNCGGLRLDDMLKADDGNLMHDIGGIARHLNRKTFELEDCFLPRFSA